MSTMAQFEAFRSTLTSHCLYLVVMTSKSRQIKLTFISCRAFLLIFLYCRSGIISRSAVSSHSLAIQITFVRPFSITSIPGFYQLPMIKRFVSGTGNPEPAFVFLLVTIIMSCVPNSIQLMIRLFLLRWIKQFASGISQVFKYVFKIL